MKNIGCEYPLVGEMVLNAGKLPAMEDCYISNIDNIIAGKTVITLPTFNGKVYNVTGDVNLSPISIEMYKQNPKAFKLIIERPMGVMEGDVTVKVFLCHPNISYYAYEFIIGEVEDVKPNLTLTSKYNVGNVNLHGLTINAKKGFKTRLTVNTPFDTFDVPDYILVDLIKNNDVVYLTEKLQHLTGMSSISGSIKYANELMRKENATPSNLRLDLHNAKYPRYTEDINNVKLFNPLNNIEMDKVLINISENGKRILERIKMPVNGNGKFYETTPPVLVPIVGKETYIERLSKVSTQKGFVDSKYTLTDMCNYFEVILVEHGFDNIKDYNKTMIEPLAVKEKDSLMKIINSLEEQLTKEKDNTNRIKTEHIKELELLTVKHANELHNSNTKYHTEHITMIDTLKKENDKLKDIVRDLKDENRYLVDKTTKEIDTKYTTLIEEKNKTIIQLQLELSDLKHTSKVTLDTKLKEYADLYHEQAKTLVDENTSLKNSLDVQLKRFESTMLEVQNNKRVLETNNYGDMLTLMYRYKGLCELLTVKHKHKEQLRELKRKEKTLTLEHMFKEKQLKHATKVELNKLALDEKKIDNNFDIEERKLKNAIKAEKKRDSLEERQFNYKLEREEAERNRLRQNDLSIKPTEDELNGYTMLFDSDMVRIFENESGHHRVYHVSHGWLNRINYKGDVVYYYKINNDSAIVYSDIIEFMNNPEQDGKVISFEELTDTGNKESIVDRTLNSLDDLDKINTISNKVTNIFMSLTDGLKTIRRGN